MLGYSFIVITLVTLIISFLATGKESKIWWLFGIWGIFISTLAYSGFFLNTTSLPPRLIFVLLPSTLLIIYLYRKIDINSIKINYLIGLHIIRIPVELVLYQLYVEGRIPEIMTFSGWNYDIVVGITAVIVLLLLKLQKEGQLQTLLKVWNIFGIIMLTIIVSIAILSAPFPFQQLAFEQPNVAVLRFPYILLPSVIVPLVYLSHFITLKWLANNHLRQ